MNVEKLAVEVNTSLEQVYNTEVDWSIISGPRYTPEQVQANRAREKARIEGLKRTWQHMVLIAPDRTGIRVLDLHQPNEYGSCDGDHGYEEGSPWPCETVKAVADVYRFDLEDKS